MSQKSKRGNGQQVQRNTNPVGFGKGKPGNSQMSQGQQNISDDLNQDALVDMPFAEPEVKKQNAFTAFTGRIAAKITSFMDNLRGKSGKNGMLDKAEYNRRIEKLDKEIRYVYVATEDKLLKILADLKRQYKDGVQNASREDQVALSACIKQLQQAVDRQNKNKELRKFRETTYIALREYRNALESLRDTPPEQTDKQTNVGQEASGAAKPQNNFLDTKSRVEETAQNGAALPSIEKEPDSSEEIKTATTQAPELEAWKRRYEETNTLLVETKTLLEKTKTDFNIRMMKIEKQFADELAAAETMQVETQAVADQAIKAEEEKQQRIIVLEREKQAQEIQIAKLEGMKLALETRIAELEADLTKVKGQETEAKSKWAELQKELAEQQEPDQARTALEKDLNAMPDMLKEFVTGLLDVTDHAQASDVDWLEANHNALLKFVYTPPEAVSLLAERQFGNISRLYQVLTVQNYAHVQLKAGGIEPIYPGVNEPFQTELHEAGDRDIVWNNSKPELNNTIEAILRVGFRNARSGKVLKKAWVRRYVYRGAGVASATNSPGRLPENAAASAPDPAKPVSEPQTAVEEVTPGAALDTAHANSTLPPETTVQGVDIPSEPADAGFGLMQEQPGVETVSPPDLVQTPPVSPLNQREKTDVPTSTGAGAETLPDQQATADAELPKVALQTEETSEEDPNDGNLDGTGPDIGSALPPTPSETQAASLSNTESTQTTPEGNGTQGGKAAEMPSDITIDKRVLPVKGDIPEGRKVAVQTMFEPSADLTLKEAAD